MLEATALPLTSHYIQKCKVVCNLLQAASGDASPISWNFAKFLVAKDGTVFAR